MVVSNTSPDVDTILGAIDASLSQPKGRSRNKHQAAPARRQREPRDRAVTRLSVLMPVHNARWTIGDAVQRVLHAPVSLDLEIVAVDDGSSDGTGEHLERLAAREPRLHVVRHDRRRGPGAAIRTAIQHMTGDMALVPGDDLDCDPRDFANLVEPVQRGDADAVFGSRFAGGSRRVPPFWQSLFRAGLTTVSNGVNNLSLTDTGAGCKVVRADLLKRLSLKSNTTTLQPELTARLAQCGARIHEAPVRDAGPAEAEGGCRPAGSLRALWETVRCRFVDPCFTPHSGHVTLAAVAHANRYNAWLLEQCAPFLGNRLLEAGAGIGNLSTRLANRERLVLVDYDSLYVERLKVRFRGRSNIRVLQADLTSPHVAEAWQDERLDAVFCSNVLEHLEPDVQVLRSFHQSLLRNGHCIIIVPAEQSLFMPLDSELGHFRRYSQDELRGKMRQAGFEVVFTSQFCRIGALAWWWNGRVLKRRHLSPRQMVWFDRIWPIARHLDRLLPVPGMSLMMVGRRVD